MTTAEPALPRLPFPRPTLLELAPKLTQLRAEAPLARVLTPAGDPAWLVSGYERVRALYGDHRLGRSHPDAANAAVFSDAAIQSGPSGDHDSERSRHRRMRKLLAPAFSAKRMRALEEHIEDLIGTCLDGMAAAAAPGEPVDLHEYLSFPLPALVISELLGVPADDRQYFRALSSRIGQTGSGGDATEAMTELHAYMARLTDRKRTDPGQDVLSDLLRAQAHDPAFRDDDLVGLATALLFAGHETTVTRIDYGVVLLLTNPERINALESAVDELVEEVLRLAAPTDLGVLRYAHDDIELGDQVIRRGDAVMLSSSAANRDPAAFADPESFDPGRDGDAKHLAFGHGAHFCPGASLARVELRAVFPALFRRFPALRLATPAADLPARHGHVTGGFTTLPVVW